MYTCECCMCMPQAEPVLPVDGVGRCSDVCIEIVPASFINSSNSCDLVSITCSNEINVDD